ncbi:MAG: sulfatase-like hydrolase/transferase [Bacteroidota bacterium]|nr:sulfatase-like hydrolase/transferase [Bacteroidota bacterium]
MKKYIKYLVYFGFWLFYFIVTRVLFLIYHHPLTSGLTGGEIVNSFLYGIRMDASFTAYICIFPFFTLLIQSFFTNLKIKKIIRIYTIAIIVILSFITTTDLELYTAWGYRMDATPLQYFKSPEEMGGTVLSAPLFSLLIIFILLTVFFIWLYRIIIDIFFTQPSPKENIFLRAGIALFLLVFLFVPIRGGIQKIPINQSDAYFSPNLFADHAAINLPWNVVHSILNRNSQQNPFDYFSIEKSQRLVDSLYNTGPLRIPSILSIKKPNVIFIILESYTAKLVGCLGGEPGVTPNIDKIASEGLLFTNIYAAGDRSEKGQVAVLSGYPNQAITSIIKTPTKTQHLPSINKSLEKEGYHTSYTYGGELEFANIKSYLLNVGFKTLVSKYSFEPSERNTSWGVHDHIVLNRFFQNINKEQQPFFATIFTLSSHEPYDVPMSPRFKGNDETTLFKNSVAYTDSCVGNFINKLKKDTLWKNTLVVLVADHGHPLPGHDPNDRPSKFHIPLIFTGGALTLKGINKNIGSQTDIATTVLHQLGLPANDFKWGKDLLDSSARQFAFYSFNNGFGFVNQTGTVTIDNVSKKIIYKDGSIDSSSINPGKAYMQASYEDFLRR